VRLPPPNRAKLPAMDQFRITDKYTGMCSVQTQNKFCFINLAVFSIRNRGVFRPRQTRQLPRAVDLKGRLLSCQSY